MAKLARPQLSTGVGDGVSQELAGAKMLGTPVDPQWIDKFMQHIFARDYGTAREVLRRAVASGLQTGVAEQYGSVLEDFLKKRDELENPAILDTKGVCEVREINDTIGRGLIVPRYKNWGDELYNERPLVYMQSPSSKRGARVCCACLVPVGSLATQLAHLGLPVPSGAESIVPPGSRDGGNFHFCPGAGDGCCEVFCSVACREWASVESPHAVLCVGKLSSEGRQALQELERFAEARDEEHLLLLAHSCAQMLIQLRRGVPLEVVLQRYARQFISRRWEDPGLAELSDATSEQRVDMLAHTQRLLVKLFGNDKLAEPLVDETLLSGLLGTFELVNMCISLPHPLNSDGAAICGCLEPSALAEVAKAQGQVYEDDSDEEPDADKNLESVTGAESVCACPETQEVISASDAVAMAEAGDLFSNIIGSALVEGVAFTNHSCLPNCNIDFAANPTGTGDELRPGLWVTARARRPLMPGDEVLMCYVPSIIGKPLAVRQERMRKFGFPCRCRCCVTDEMLEKEGDII